MLQDGDSGGTVGGVARGDLDHRASFLHFEIGYQFDAPGSPNLMFQYDRATGDEDPTDAQIDRFNTLFGARRFDFGPTGIYGIVAPQQHRLAGRAADVPPRPALASDAVVPLAAARVRRATAGSARAGATRRAPPATRSAATSRAASRGRRFPIG